MQRETSFNWLPVLAIAGLGLGLLWFLGHARRPTIDQVVPSTAVGTANRLALPVSKPVCALPANVNLPQGGAAARLLTFVQNPDAKPVRHLDHYGSDCHSTRDRPGSGPSRNAQLNNIATVLTNCPAVHLDIAGYTDNVGSAEANLRLSRIGPKPL